MATPVDPLFILLPALEKAAGRGYCDSEAIVEGVGAMALAVPALRQAKFDAVCETKTAGDLSFYLLNKAKVEALRGSGGWDRLGCVVWKICSPPRPGWHEPWLASIRSGNALAGGQGGRD